MARCLCVHQNCEIIHGLQSLFYQNDPDEVWFPLCLQMNFAKQLHKPEAAVVRIHPLPERLERDSLRFPNWDQGVGGPNRVLRPGGRRLISGKGMDVDPYDMYTVCGYNV